MKSFRFCLPFYEEAYRRSCLISNINKFAAAHRERVVLILFEFIDQEIGNDKIGKKLHDFDRMETVINMMQCAKQKDVCRIGLRKILLIIYGGDQSMATTLIGQIRTTFENTDLKDWAEKMHFSISEIPYSDAFQTQLVNKFNEANIISV